MRESLCGKKTNRMTGCKDATSTFKRFSRQTPQYINTLISDDRRRFGEKLKICIGDRDKIEFIQSPYVIWDVKKTLVRSFLPNRKHAVIVLKAT